MHFGRDTTGRFVYWHAVGALFFNPAARDGPLAVLRNDRNAFQGCTSVFPHTLYPSLQPETRELEQHRYNTNSAFLKTHDLSPHRAARVTRDLPPPHNGLVSYTQANAPAAVNVAPRPENQPHLLAPEAEAAFRARQLDSLQELHDEAGVGALNAVSLNQGRHALAQRSLSISEEQPETVPNLQMNLQADSAEDVEGEYAPSVGIPGQALAQESEIDSYASDYWNEVEEFHAILREED
ncbi:hypothetical protein CspeluHIS016_0300170 [Cutaneotrichosporon spelunceum]|uniref:Uncharacterized protein n=1 Tax=Cutaneotrichosporon spelunceum TaxID=1672016 RepID=A0AAD3TSS2_9TREE|nr:hypothetical protein CspeluHIS016_0300170 [Cutaneotrichosporon spelunceum]